MKRKLNLKYMLFLFLLPIAILITGCTGQEEKPAHYKKANLKIISTDFISKGILLLKYAAIKEDRIFAINEKYDICELSLIGKKEEKIIDCGIGPNEIYKPKSIVIDKNNAWSISWLGFDKIFRFNVDKNKPKVDLIPLPSSITAFDAIFPLTLSGNEIAGVDADWKDHLLKIINLETGSIKGAGERTFIKAMTRFNVNQADLFIYNGNVYITQSIKPEVQVFSLEPLRQTGRFSLSPPFYEAIPGAYDVPKNNRQAHLEWVARWTAIQKILVDKDWLFIRYVRGAKVAYYYELINLLNTSERYYIDATHEYIFDFKVVDGKFLVMSCEEDEDEIRWKKGEIIIVVNQGLENN